MKAIYSQNFLIAALLCYLTVGCATTDRKSDHTNFELKADHVITVTDDFIVDVYLNGMRIPDNNRKLLLEMFGATVEKISVQVHKGDWLVFHVVNNRLRWGGCYYFAAAGVLQPDKFGFVSETLSGNWSACDLPGKAQLFTEKKTYMQRNRAHTISRVWQDGTPLMKNYAGKSWVGEPLWGLTRDTWLKVIIK